MASTVGGGEGMAKGNRDVGPRWSRTDKGTTTSLLVCTSRALWWGPAQAWGTDTTSPQTTEEQGRSKGVADRLPLRALNAACLGLAGDAPSGLRDLPCTNSS